MWRTGILFSRKKSGSEGGFYRGTFRPLLFFRRFYNHDDGCYTTLRLLNYMSRTNKSLSQLVDEFAQIYFQPGDKSRLC